MDERVIVQRLRSFLLLLTCGMCTATIVELLLANHTEDLVQWMPLGLCGAGLVAAGAALLRPGRGVLLALRATMGALIVGSLFGIYEHLSGNLAFELEIRPGAAGGDVWMEALQGAAPLLAPGILILAALLGIAGTYYHPALQRLPGSAAHRNAD
jgi:hypothetical protein